MNFSIEDLQQLKQCGIEPSKAERQISLLRTGQTELRLERPCTLGDGITQLEPASFSRLNDVFEHAATEGRLQRFVPASGAASRMFKDLQFSEEELHQFRCSKTGQQLRPAPEPLTYFLENLAKFAFYDDLMKAMAEDGHSLEEAINQNQLELIFRYLLEPCGLSYTLLPKALLAFHTANDGARTPFIEHLAEAALTSGFQEPVQLHFTVSPQHEPLFRAQLSAWGKTLENSYGCHFNVSYSIQKPSTDTLALDSTGQPLRGDNGRLVLRPGGHGALLENLNDLAADIVYIRNIDNVVPDIFKQANLTWSRLLTGFLLETQQEQYSLLKLLHGQPEDPLTRELAMSFLIDRLQVDINPGVNNKTLMAVLNRPMRVCGMVKNSGEPGGGPFWVRNSQGHLSRQIVEGAQIDRTDPSQNSILSQSSHFNPVDMVCGVRDWQGRPYNLTHFVDENAAIVSTKHHAGQQIRILELPGLWNGGMSKWHTLFVEIPPEAFNPVKTVFDLLRPRHQG